jgi:hypothetical protein
MLGRLADDAYSYLKHRWWGRPLIVIIAVGLLLFYLWGTLAPSQKEGILSLGERNTAQSPPKSDFTEQELGYRNLVINTCRGVREPRKAYDLARNLPTSLAREAEMASLVVDAVCVGDELLALEIFAGLNSAEQRDDAAKQAASVYIAKDRFPDAARWIAFLSNSQDKGWWTRRILETSQRKR